MSEQVRSSWENGKGQTQRHVTQVRGEHGIKSVETYDAEGKQLGRKEKKLTPNEMDCIKRNEFIPGLFNDCVKSLENGKERGKERAKERGKERAKTRRNRK